MKKTAPWLAAAIIIFIAFGTIYGTVQQSQRLEANSPQIQLAEDASTALDHRSSPHSLVSGTVNMESSLAPFVIIYNKSGQAVASSGFLNGSIPQAPQGILTASAGKPYHAVTWQPTDKVRIAAVTASSKNYYVLSGRSLTEVEKNESRTFQLAFAGGVLSLIVLGAAYLIARKQ